MEDFANNFALAGCYILPREGYELKIGRKSGSDIIILDEHISADHLHIQSDRAHKNITVTIKGRNGARLNGQLYEKGEKVNISCGAIIEMCSFWICIGRYHCFIEESECIRTCLYKIDSHSICRKNNSERVVKNEFIPSIRSEPAYNCEPYELDNPPPRRNPEKQPLLLAAGPALTMVVPILLGSGRKIMIIAGVISAVWATANVVFRRKKAILEEKRRRRTYTEYVSRCENDISDRVKEIKNTMNSAYPNLLEFLKGGGNVHLMWNRSKDSSDYLFLRTGIGEMDFPVEIKYQREKFSVTEDSLKSIPSVLKKKYSKIKDVPICVDLGCERLFGISTLSVNGGWDLAFSLALYLAVTIRSDDIKIAFLSANRMGLESLAFLPHSWIGERALIADDLLENEISTVIKGYSGMVAVFTDRVEIIKEFAGYHNVAVFFIAEEFDQIPPFVDCVFHVSSSFSGIIRNNGINQKRITVIFDRISLKNFGEFCRQIGSLSTHISDNKHPIPEKVLLMDLLDIEEDEIDSIGRIWIKNGETDSLKVPIGVGADERSIYLNLDEKGDGPHGLVAGTTGSGKSELLQTLILSLSVNYSPDEVVFFLIDYKGGGMANMFHDLPHLAGSISNLSGTVIERAMVSIRSEIRYRQEQFSSFCVNNIREYRKIAKMPHIVIIIDEFAELKKEEPEFMAQLVSVAQVGRSLGVHLILSTQKPAGVVDDKIWSNSRFRICLKVRDKIDSNDMLHRPDASYITNVGRAFLQVGNDEVFEEFQCGYTSAPVGKKNEDNGIRLYDSKLRQIPLNTDVYDGKQDKEQELFLSQVDLLKALTTRAFANGEYKSVRKLWLPELEPLILPSEETESELFKSINKKDDCVISLGVYDDPVNQTRGEYSIDISRVGNIAVVGSPGSGKSIAVTSVINQLIRKNDTKSIQFYILDFGGKRLEIFSKSKMCGGYVGIDDYDRISKLIRFIDEQVKIRQREKSCEGPHILVVVDNYGGMLEYGGMEHESKLLEILRNCKSQSTSFLVTAGNIGSGELPARAAALMDMIIPLSLKDRYSYAAALNTTTTNIPSIEQLPGRGIVKIEQRNLAFQCYTPVREEDENKWEDKITEVIKKKNCEYSANARGFPYVPRNPTLKGMFDYLKACNDDLSHCESYNSISSISKNNYPMLPIGYEGETGKIFYLPLDFFGVMLIGGRLRSGRKNTLKVISCMAMAVNISVFFVNRIDDLSKLIQNNEKGIVLIDNVGDALCDFYKEGFDPNVENIVVHYIETAEITPSEANLKIIGVISGKDRISMMGRRIWTALTQHPYGLCLGGALEEFNMFDFSYMSYSSMQKRCSAGKGNIAYFDEDVFFGNVVIPLCEDDETC